LRKFDERSNSIRRVKLTIEFGMRPEKAHHRSRRTVNFLSSPTASGIGPENKQDEISKLIKLLRLPTEGAIGKEEPLKTI
jgi:hypothetical protein